MSEREILEASLVSLMEPLLTEGKLKSALAVGGMTEEDVQAAALVTAPYALIQYVGKTGARQGGGVKQYRARVSVLLAVENLQSVEERRGESYELQEAVEAAIQDQSPGEGFMPWDLAEERFVAAAQDEEGGNLEVWEQIWETTFWKE